MRDRRGERGRDVAAHDEAAQHLRGAAETAELVILTAEHLDHLLAFDGFLQHVHHVAERAQRLARHAPQALGDQAHRERDGRSDDQCDQRELPVEIEQPRQQPDDGNRIPDQHREHRGRRAGHAGDVVGHLRKQRARSVVVEVAGGQAHQAREHRRAQVEHHLVRHPVQAVRRAEGEDAADQEHADDRRGKVDRQPGRRAALRETTVEQRLDQRREQRLGGRGRHHAEHREREQLRVGPHIRQQPRIDLQAAGGKRLHRSRIVEWHPLSRRGQALDDEFVILFTESSRNLGGQELQLLEQARGLAGRRIDVRLACPPASRIAALAPEFGVPVSPVAFRNSLHPPSVLRVRTLIAQSRPEAVCHSGHDADVCALAARLVSGAPGSSACALISTACRTPGRITTCSTARSCRARKCAHACWPIPACAPSASPCCAPESRSPAWTPAAQPLDEAWKRRLPASRRAASRAAMLRAEKGHLLMLEGWLDCDCAMCVTWSPGEMAQALRSKVKAYGLEKNVLFAGLVRNLPALYAKSELVVMPSTYEPRHVADRGARPGRAGVAAASAASRRRWRTGAPACWWRRASATPGPRPSPGRSSTARDARSPPRDVPTSGSASN